ncbi:flagellar hook-basal body complex protein [Planococcus wigleyi]|uniref:Flagellar hook protein FlgE n=1 Tax=Planococcus wigleyi TaxID=2762216 RepID=A0ABR8WD42_9BACL|nr:flagellar hook-basal body complex protein [Planococcus wigleyi]MBD8014914.1 flagellar hook-basal body complex protein [Planococcus wigleyi]
MLRSMYSGVSGMKNFQTKLDVIGNNISNVNTIGYKKSTINFQDLMSQNMSNSGSNPMQVGLGSSTSSINVVHTPGSSMSTGVGTDLTVSGDGFFVVGSNEDPRLTRSGSFTVDDDGVLKTTQGLSVLDSEGKEIKIDEDYRSSFIINSRGEIKVPGEDTATFPKLGIVTVDNPSSLRKLGGSMYGKPTDAPIRNAEDAKVAIGSGQLEMSNVDLTEEFTEMIIAQRGFQANSRTITTSDELLQEVVNLKR